MISFVAFGVLRPLRLEAQIGVEKSDDEGEGNVDIRTPTLLLIYAFPSRPTIDTDRHYDRPIDSGGGLFLAAPNSFALAGRTVMVA